MRYCLLLFFLLIAFKSSFGQEKPEVDLSTLIDDWVQEKGETYEISNVRIVDDGIRSVVSGSRNLIGQYLKKKHGANLIIDENGIINVGKGLKLNNVEIDWLDLREISFTYLEVKNSTIKRLLFNKVFLDSMSLKKVKIEQRGDIGYSSFSNKIFLEVDSEGGFMISKTSLPGYIMVARSHLESFSILDSWSNDLDEFLSWENDTLPYGITKVPKINQTFQERNAEFFVVSMDQPNINFSSSKIGELRITNNVLPAHHLRIYTDFENVQLRRNIFSLASIYNAAYFSELAIEENTFLDGMELEKLLTEVSFDIDWPDIKGKLLIGGDTLRHATANETVNNMKRYKQFSQAFSSLHIYYKAIGMLEFANECYIEWMNMRGIRLKWIYNREGGFENFFKWKLNSLMRNYTKYGTSPAQAIVASLYIIFGFAIFYFFFPSDWDVTSKKNLISNFSDFKQKNDKGYFKPLLNLLSGLIISFLNAITLSLNSFITLGFGNIPTRGLARYVCIIQGFMGWFLLSIFTVALINQIY